MRNSTKAFSKITLILLLLSLSSLLCGFTKAVTYTGNEWAVNFWESELNHLSRDFEQIRGDGFNTVILSVPWRHFQPSVKDMDQNPEAYRQLRRILRAAEDADLKVILRAGYTWDTYTAGDSVLSRYRTIRTDLETRKAWLRYLSDLYRSVSGSPAFAGAFITWEDFWNYLDECVPLSGSSRGPGVSASQVPKKGGAYPARDSGYQEWVMQHYDKDTIRAYYGSAWDGESPVDFPSPDSPARLFVFQWNDHWLMDLLRESQQVFPGLSLEVRLDIDPVHAPGGGFTGAEHSSTYGAGSAGFTSCMYSASMGYGFGTELSAAQAVEQARSILGGLRDAAGKPVFVDQLLYMDNTPGFEDNAHIRPDEIPAFLTGMAPVLEEAGWGYAVWTYQDYVNNVIRNGGFGLGETAWDLSGGASVHTEDGNSVLRLKTGAKASQRLRTRRTSTDKENIISFRWHAPEGALLSISTGTASFERRSVSGDGVLTIRTGTNISKEFTVFCEQGEADLDDIQVYSHTSEGGIYTADGQPGPLLPAIRTLNALLPD